MRRLRLPKSRGTATMLLGIPIILVGLTLNFSFTGSGVPPNEWCTSEDAEALRGRRQHNVFDVQELLRRTGDGQIVLIAHRGGYTCEELFAAPENSIANIEKAVQLGLDGYEADVWPTRDRNFVIHHDSGLERTTTGDGKIANYTLVELRELNLKFPSGRLSLERIPSLHEFLVAGNGRLLFMLEIKRNFTTDFPAMLRIVKEADAIDNTLFWLDATRENVDAFENLINSGIQGIQTSVVWRVDSLEQLKDVSTRIQPRFVDFPILMPIEWSKEWSEESYDRLFPHEHFQLVKEGQKYPFTPMVSRIRTNKYMDALYREGIRIFVLKTAEIQLHHAVENGLHF